MGTYISRIKSTHTLPSIQLCDLENISTREEGMIFLLLGNLVIDATYFIDSHPGGTSSIRNKHMCDITDDFKFHSKQTQNDILSMAVYWLE